MKKVPDKPASPQQVRYGSNADGSVNVEEHEIIREIVERVFVNGESPTAVADDLNSRAVATKRGGQWRASTVTKIAEDNKIKVAPGVWMPPPTAKRPPSLTQDLEFNWFEEDSDADVRLAAEAVVAHLELCRYVIRHDTPPFPGPGYFPNGPSG